MQRIAAHIENPIDHNTKDNRTIFVNTDKYHSLKREIEKLDRETDAEIYELYDFSPEEISIIENEVRR